MTHTIGSPETRPSVAQRSQREAGTTRPPARRRGIAYMAACITLAGIAVGRFVAIDSDAPTPRAVPVAAVSVTKVGADDVARLEATLAANPNDARALQQIAVAYVRRAAYGDPSYYDLARRALDRATKIAPNDDLTLIARGVLDLSLHRFDLARVLGLRVQQHNPSLNDADAVLVDASVELGHYDDAQRYLQALVDRRPGLPAYARVSYVRELHGDETGAIEAMRLAINAGAGVPGDVGSVTQLLGDVEFAGGHLDDAARSYDEALRLVPNLPLAELGRAKVQAAQGDVAGAIRRLTTLTQRYPLPAAVGVLGDLERSIGRTADANQSYALVRAIAGLQRRSGQVTDLETAQFALDHNDVSGGAAMAEAAYRARPDNVYVDDVLAWARYRAGDFAAAQRLERQALRIGTADASLHWHAAAIAFELGDRAGAAAELRRALGANPWFTFAVRGEVAALAHELGVAFEA